MKFQKEITPVVGVPQVGEVVLRPSDFQEKCILLPENVAVFTGSGVVLSQNLCGEELAKSEGDFAPPVSITALKSPHAIEQKCIKITCENGDTAVLPPKAVVSTKRGKKFAENIELGDEIYSFVCEEPQDLEEGDIFSELKTIDFFRGYLLGQLVSNGSISAKVTTSAKKGKKNLAVTYTLYFCFLPHQTEILDRAQLFARLLGVKSRVYRPNVKYSHTVCRFAIPKAMFPKTFATKEEIDEWMLDQTSLPLIKGFIRGLLQGDGTCKGSEIRLVQSHEGRMKLVKLLLLRLGIFSRVKMASPAGQYKFYHVDSESGERVITKTGPKKASFYLNVHGPELRVFERVVGFDVGSEKEADLKALIEGKKIWSQTEPTTGAVLEKEEVIVPVVEAVLRTTVGVRGVQIGLHGIKCIF